MMFNLIFVLLRWLEEKNLKIVFFQNKTLGRYVEKLLCIIFDMLKCQYAEVLSYVVSNDVLSSDVKT